MILNFNITSSFKKETYQGFLYAVVRLHNERQVKIIIIIIEIIRKKEIYKYIKNSHYVNIYINI